MVTMTGLSSDFPWSGRMSTRSTTAPNTNPIAKPATKAHQYPTPRPRRLEAMNVVIMAMAPWAKLTIRVARKMRTSARANAAKIIPLAIPLRVMLTKRLM